MPGTKPKILKKVSILLGFISIINMTLLGIHIVNYCLAFSFLSQKLLTEAIIVGFTTTISVGLTSFGSYSIHKDHYLRGGLCNIIAGTITAGTYIHYTLDFPILQQFGLLGYILLVPAPMSGIIAIIISKAKIAY